MSVQEFLASFVEGKSVLDVGCVAHAVEREATGTWLHKHLCRSAARCVGLDCNGPAVAELNRRGYRVLCGDAMTMDIGERFDVVTAGEIIEHVENAGMLIRNLRRHLNPGGSLVITTPHVFFGMHVLEYLFSNPYARWNPEHVSWYCSFTLANLLQRCGMEVVQCWYFARSRKLRRILRSFRLKVPGPLASTLIVVAAVTDS